MATLRDYRDERIRKLDELTRLGINPYPSHTERDTEIAEITRSFEQLEGKTKTVAGRIRGIRKFGQIAFLVIRDQSGEVQIFLKKDSLEAEASVAAKKDGGLGFDQLPLLDTGDFVEVCGKVIKTQTGEISVQADSMRLLAKALRPMPTANESFSNKEERLRRRYIDTNVNRDVHDRYIRRSKFWQATRDFLNQNNFIEINTPVLEHTTGGADANPFTTHMDALDEDFFLRISHELPLKRLIGGGYEKVYDIGPRFRNENYSEEHLPEHVAMEWYWAYADWDDGMAFQEELFKYVFEKVYATHSFQIKGFDVDLSKKWDRVDYAELVHKHYKINVFDTNIEEVKAQLKAHKLEVEATDNLARSIDKLWKNLRKDIAGPVWLINTPLFISPLAKINQANPKTVQRFQPIIAGTELGNGYSELNDPIDQLNRFLEQQALRDAGDREAQMLDIDFVEMLEYGMPPTCGWGHSERAFWIFEGVSAREGVPFPHMRAEIDQTTRSIYPSIDF